jgi:cytochrome c-type biogenesis protein CcmH/NrfF
MARGLVPIVTKEVVKETDDWGITIQDHKLKTISTVVERASKMEPDKLQKMSENACEKSNNDHSRTQFSHQMRQAIKEIVQSGQQTRTNTK